MHIPDGFLEPRVWVTAGAVSAGLVAYAVRKTSAALEDRQVPLLGVTGAFIFAAQMINFPVGPGTSGHLMGSVLATAFVGPWAASLVLTVVVAIQCLVFQDGGLTALGANVLNMAFVGTFAGYWITRAGNSLFRGERARTVGLAVAAWSSIVVAALACAAELILSGAVGWKAGLLTIGGIHVVIGIGEAVITVGVVSFVRKTRPDLVLMRAGVER